MSDRRRLQRTLFRMQADAGFARDLLRGDERAVASTGLEPDDLALLAQVDPAALSADPGGKRREQTLGNAASEFLATLAAGPPDLLDGFAVSSEFHETMAAGGRLPLAFAAYAGRRARERGSRAMAAVVELEGAMARLRRELAAAGPTLDSTAAAVSIPSPRPPGEDRREGAAVSVPEAVRLAPTARLHDAPRHTLAWTDALGAAMREGGAAPAPPRGFGEGSETLLLRAVEVPVHRLADLVVERLEPPADELLKRARSPLGVEERARFAVEQGATPQELESFLDGLVREGVLVS